MTDETVKKPVSIYDALGTDVVAEEDGRWFDNFAGVEGMAFKLRRMTSKKSMQVRRRLDIDFRKHRKNGGYPDAIADEMLAVQLGEGVIMDWKGVFDKDGQPIAYSPAAAAELIRNIPALKLTVQMTAMDIDQWRNDASEDIAKN
jgi:hypothetical protein